MNRKQILWTIIFLAGLSACKKDVSDNNFVLYPSNAMNDTLWTRSLPSNAAVYSIFDSIAPQIIIDSFDVATGDTLRFNQNVEVIFPPNALIDLNGTTITGNIKVELQSLLNKGEWIKAMKSTTNYSAILETAGTFCIKAHQSSQELFLRPSVNIKIRFVDPNNNPTPTLIVFIGKDNRRPPSWSYDDDFTWIQSTDGSNVDLWNKYGSIPNKGYEITSKTLRWISIGKYADSAIAKGNLNLILPPNYTNKNTVAFITLYNSKTVVQLNANYNARTFSAKNIPLSKKINIITITKIGSNFYLGKRTIDDLGNMGIYKVIPEKISLKNILAYLDSI